MRKSLKSIIASILATTLLVSITDFGKINVYAESKIKYDKKELVVDELLSKTKEEYDQWKSQYLLESEIVPNNSPTVLALDNGIANDYIEAVVSSEGYFTIGTIEGNPDITSDNYRMLLFGHPDPGTSYTTIRIDGEDIIFNANSINVEDDKVIATMIVKEGIEIDEILSFETNETTGREDIIKISYDIRNASGTAISAGIRIMLDTMLGNNDGAPFSVAGSPLVTEKEFVGSSIPQYWQAFDNLENPDVVSNGTVYKSNYERPDKIQFCAWPSIYDCAWDYTVNESKYVTIDSAVAIYYNPTTVYPNTQKSVSTYYGVGTVGGISDGSESFRVVSPEKMTVINKNYTPNPFTITAYVKNTNSEIMYNASVSLNLPNTTALSLLSNNTVSLGNLNPGEQKTVIWQVTAVPQQQDKTFEYNLELTSTSHDSEKVVRNILLPNINNSSVDGNISLNMDKVELGIGGNVILIPIVNNIPGNVTWLSDNTAVATVDENGKVVAKARGKAKITASISGQQAVCEVNVSGDATSNINTLSLNYTEKILTVNEKVRLMPRFSPTDVVNKRIIWKSTNPAVATVTDDGVVKGIKAGETEIIATSELGGKIARCKIKVYNNFVEFILDGGINFNTVVSGPSLSFLNKRFNLFETKVEIELLEDFPFIGDKVKLSYDPEQDMFIGTFGDFSDDFNTKDNIKDRQAAYKQVKSLMGMLGKKTNREFYNKWRALTKKKGPLLFDGSSTAFGYVGLVKQNGQWVLAEGEVGVLGEASAEYKQPTPIASVFFKFGLSGNAQLGIKPVLKEAGNLAKGVFWNGNFKGETGLSAAVGFDSYVANVYGGVEGALESELDFPIGRKFVPSRDLSISASLSAFLEYEALMLWGDKRSWKFAKFPIYPANSRISELMSIDIKEENLSLIERVNSVNHLGSSIAMMSNLDNSQLIIEDVFPNTKTQLYEIGNKKILVWVGDDSTRSTTNRTALYYSVFDGIWSTPVIVDDDGTGDFTFDGYINGNDLYLTWQNGINILADDASIDDFTKNMEICVAKYDGNSKKFLSKDVISDGSTVLNSQPSITGSNNDIVVTWISNSANDISGIKGKNTINTAKLKNNQWAMDNIKTFEEGNIVGGLDTLNIGKNSFITYTMSQGSEAQSDVYLIDGNEAPINISDNNVNDSHPVLVNNSGKAELYWLSDSDISLYDITSKNKDIIVSGSNAVRGFNIDINNDKGMIYWEDTKGLVTTITGSLLDTNTGDWSNGITLVSGDNGRLVGSSGYIENDGTMNFVYATAPIIGEPGEVDDIFGKSDMYFIRLIPKYEVNIPTDGISFNEDEVVAGAELTLNAQVYNCGQLSVDNVMLQLYDTNGNKVAEQLNNSKLAIGELDDYKLQYKLPINLQKGEYIMYARPYVNGNIINDGVLDNTGTTFTIGKANLEFVDLSISGSGKNKIVKADIKNNGYDTVQDNIVVKLYADDELIDTKDIGKLNGQSNTSTYFDLDISKFDFSEEHGDVLLRVEVECNPSDTLNVMQKSILLENPYSNYAITISALTVLGDKLIFNINNNLPEKIKGVLLIQDNYTNISAMNTYGMNIELEPYYSDIMEIDLSVIGDINSNIRLMVTNNEDVVISNATNFILDSNKVLYPLEINTTEGGIVALGQDGRYAVGTEILLKAIADDGYEFEGWISEGGGVFENSKLSETKFIMPECGTVVTPIFKKIETIEKLQVTFKVSENNKKYNGNNQEANISVKVNGNEKITENDYSISYMKDGIVTNPKEEGVYDIYVTILNDKFTMDNNGDSIGKLTITRDEIGENDYLIKGTEGKNNWFNSDVEIVAKKGYNISLDEKNWENSLVVNNDGKNIVPFYIKKSDGSITKVKTITISKDTVNPKIQAEFLKESGLLVVNATDETAGIENIKVVLGNKEILPVEGEVNKFQLNSCGEYQITVTDNSGLFTKLLITVNEIVNKVPEIIANDLTIVIGDKYDPLKGVIAKDKEDGDITNKIKVIKNTVDTAKAGKYKVVYEVSDSKGQTVRKEIIVTVKDKIIGVNGGLPQTGGNNSFTVVMFALVCLALGIWSVFRKKVINYNNNTQ